jgi:hypothetical protein
MPRSPEGRRFLVEFALVDVGLDGDEALQAMVGVA